MLLLLLFPGAAALLLHVVMQCTARKYLKFSMIIHWKKGGGRCQPNSNKCSMRWSVLIITLSWQSFKYKNEKNNIFFDSVRRLYNNKSTRLKIWRIKTGGRWGVKSLIPRLSRKNIDMAIASFWGGGKQWRGAVFLLWIKVTVSWDLFPLPDFVFSVNLFCTVSEAQSISQTV